MNLRDLLFGKENIEMGEPQPQYGEGLQSYLDSLDEQEYFKNLVNGNPQTALTPDEYKRGITQGLNYGIPEIAEAQKQLGVRVPITGEDKYNASIGEFNKYPVIKVGISGTPREGGLLDDFSRGYNENYNNRFAVSNLMPSGKNWATRIGEGLGTVGRFIDSPLGRGLMAGALNSALGYSDSAKEGLTAYVGRQNNQTADRIYRNQLKQFGFSEDELNQIKGNITGDIYKNLISNMWKYRNLDQNTYVKMKTLYDRQLQQGILTPDEYKTNVDALNNQYINSQIQTMQTGEVQKSNQTRNTDINEYLAPHKANAYDSGAMAGLMNASTNQGRLALQTAEFERKIQEGGIDKATIKQYNENMSTISDIDAGIQAIMKNPNAYTFYKGVLGANITNRIDPKGVKTRTQIDNITAVYRKWLTGAQMSDAERKAYERFLPAPTDNGQIVLDKLQGMKESIERKNAVLTGQYVGTSNGGTTRNGTRYRVVN